MALLGDILYRAASLWTRLSGNVTTTRKFLRQVGDGANSAAPAWDDVKDSDVVFTDITTNNVSTTKHGYTPKLPNDATKYLDGTGAYTVPAGSGSYTDEQAQDAVGSILTDTSTIDFTYNDATPSIEAIVKDSSITETKQILADVTTHNVSTSKHGYAPKGDGDATKFLNSNGAYSVPGVSGGGGASYDSIVLADSPVGYWKLDETSGTTITDSSGNSQTGTLAGSGYTQGVTGLPGISGDLALLGSSTVAITVPDATILDISPTITIEAWFKHSTSNFSGPILFKSTSIFSGSATNMVYEFGFLNGTLFFQVSNGSNTFSVSYIFTPEQANIWHLIAATWIGTTATNGIKIYCDGQVVAQGTSTFSTIRSTADDLKVVGKSGSANAFEHFPGTINQIALYNTYQPLGKHTARYLTGLALR